MSDLLSRTAGAWYFLELSTIEHGVQTIYRLRMRWRKGFTDWRGYRKTWKYKVIQNAINKLHALVERYGEPTEVKIFGFRANLAELGLRLGSGPAEPL